MNIISEEDLKLWNEYCKKYINNITTKLYTYDVQDKISIDLHGYSLQDAYNKVNYILSLEHIKEIRIITGKSGKINKEFLYWIEGNKRIKRITKENDGGSFLITMKKDIDNVYIKK